MSTAAILTITRREKQPKGHQLMNGQSNTMEYYSAMKRNAYYNPDES